MAKSKARFLAELLGDSGKVKESKSALEITGGKIKLAEVPEIPNSKLENSSISIAGHSTALGGSVSLNTGDITEHTDYKYYTDARVRAAISVSGNALSYNSSTGVITSAYEENPSFSSIDVNGNATVSGYLNFDGGSQNGLIRFNGENAIGYSNEFLYINPSNHFTSGVYINSALKVDTGKIGSYNEDLQLRTGNTTALTLSNTDQSATFAGNIIISGTVDGRDVSADGSKLDGIASNANNYSLPTATSSALGGIKIGYTENGKNYPVELSNGQAYVNVPWVDTNTTYSVGDGGLTQKNFTTTLKTKLDGIETGATADQTAAEILTAIKTVDGASSGLDADLLDGQQGSYYLAAGNLTGTISVDRLNQPTSGDWWSGGTAIVQTDGVMEIGKYIDFHNTDTATSDFDTRLYSSGSNQLTINGSGRILTTADEGSGNGLDADTLDGQHGSYYLSANNFTGTLSNARLSSHVDIGGQLDIGVSSNVGVTYLADRLWISSHTTGQSDVPGSYYDIINLSSSSAHGIQIASGYGANSGLIYIRTRSDNNSAPAGAGLQAWNKIWHNNNDGSGSGLDADTLDGQGGGYYLDYNNFTNKPTLYLMNQNVRSTDSPTFADLTVTGNLNITGDINSYNVTDLDVTDKTITVGVGASASVNDGAGLVVDGASASILWENSLSQFRINKNIEPQGVYLEDLNGTVSSRFGIYGWDNELQFTKRDLSNNNHSGTLMSLDYSTNNAKFYGSIYPSNQSTNYVSSSRIANWQTAYSWGNHASAGYLTASSTQSKYLRSDTADTATGTITFSAGINVGDLSNGGITGSNYNITGVNTLVMNDPGEGIQFAGTTNVHLYAIDDSTDSIMNFASASEIRRNNNKMWDAGNDGSGSGLDADLLDGEHKTKFMQVNSGTKNSGNFNNFTDSGNFIISNHANISNSPPNSYAHGLLRVTQISGTSIVFQEYIPHASGEGTFIRVYWNPHGWTSWRESVTFSSDGSGSGLDADTLDGVNSGSFLRSDTADTATGVITFDGATQLFRKNNATNYYTGSLMVESYGGSNSLALMGFHISGSIGRALYMNSSGTLSWEDDLAITGSITSGGNTVWNSGNDGSGSGLDADTVDGIHASSFIQQGTHAVGNGTFSNTNPAGGFRFQRVTGGSDRFTTSHHNLLQIPNTSGNDYQAQMAFVTGGTGLGWRSKGTSWTDWYTIWHSGNDGSGSGLDADTLDGINGASFLRSDAGDTHTGGTITLGSGSSIDASTNDRYLSFRVIRNAGSANTDGMYIGYGNSGSGHTRLFGGGATTGGLYIRGSGANDLTYGNNTGVIWHSANDGSGSGLDADLLDGINSASFLRSDASDTFGSTSSNQYIRFNCNSGQYIASGGSSSRFPIEIYAPTANGGDAGLTFHISNDYAGFFGLASDWNDLAWGGWSVGSSTKYRIWHSGNDGSGSGLDADTVDGIHGSSFLRSDTEDSTSGSLIINNNWSSGTYASQFVIKGSNPSWETRGNSSQNFGWLHHQDSSGHYTLYSIAGHTGNSWTQRYTFNKDGTFRNGGPSGNVYYHQGNDGSGSGLDADLLDGLNLHTGRNNEVNKVVRTDSNGYIQAGWINTTSGSTTSALDRIYASYDGYIRYYTPSNFLNSGGMGNNIFNNQARNHSTQTNFNDTSLRAGINYLQGGTNGPTNTSGHQWYGMRLGLGADYGTQTGASGHYAQEWYIARKGQGGNSTGGNFLWTRDMEGGSWGSWQKVDTDRLQLASGYYAQQGDWGLRNTTPNGWIQFGPANNSHAHIYTNLSNFYFNVNTLYANGNTMWTAGNDGSGSGLDADNLDGYTWGSQTKNVAWRQGTTEAGNNNGIGFWGNTSGAAGSYAIYMSAQNGTYGGRVSTEGTSDYNMFFKMSAGTNRGFVFKNGSSNVAGIDGAGNFRSIGTLWQGRNSGEGTGTTHIEKIGGIRFGWNNGTYGVQNHHSIRSTFGDSYADDITLNSYNRLRFNIDTNNNNSNEVFQVGRHTTGTSNILMSLDGSGNFSVTGNVTAYSSDKRLKKNFKKLKNPLDKVLSLNGYNFDWRMDKLEGTTFEPDFETNDIGLIAQEVEAVCEQATGPAPFDVQWDENAEHLVSQSGENYLTVNYDKLVPLLVEAIKEQQDHIVQQKEHINRLEERLNKLENKDG